MISKPFEAIPFKEARDAGIEAAETDGRLVVSRWTDQSNSFRIVTSSDSE